MHKSLSAALLAAALFAAPAQANITAADRATLRAATAWLYQDGPGTGAQIAADLAPLAAQGEPRSNMMLGFMYRYGRGVAQDLDRALDHYRRALAAGQSRAALNGAGVAIDLGRGAIARELLIAADAAGEGPTYSLWAMGHLDGLWPDADKAQGARLLTQGIAAGDVLSGREALRRLARGDRLEVPLQQTVNVVERAAAGGDQYAAASLATFVARRPDLVRAPENRPNALKDLTKRLDLPEAAALELRLRAMAGQRRSVAQRAEMVQVLEAASPDAYGEVLTQLRWIDRAAYIQAVQSALVARGAFDGRQTGRMTPKFTLSLKRYCADQGLDSDCARDPLRGPISRDIAQHLAKSHQPQ